jgi:hypothetical protein
MAQKIVELYVFVSVDKAGNEGVMAFQSGRIFYPMVGADLDRVKSIIPMAEKIAKAAKSDYRILKYSIREDVTDSLK